ncbi:MAG: hypothetical protein CMJ78_23350 [Planctomycetaceae bacterium]|nr:hypothetical protein [Planctomycetaceae bacterium]
MVMPEYSYLARDDSGKMQRGRVAADSAAALRSQLESRGDKLVSFTAETEVGLAAGGLNVANPLNSLPPRSMTVEIALEQLAVLLRSGIGLLQSIQTVAEQTTSKSLRKICEQLSDDIQDGDSLADSMQRHSCFPPIVVQLVRVGESTGNLDLVLDRAAVQMTSRRENMSNVRTAMAYPAFVGTAAVLIAGYLVVFVIPELQKFLSSIGRKLPALTQSLMDVSTWIRVHGLTVGVLIVFALIATFMTYRWPPGREFIDRWSLRIPILGTVLRLGGTVTFASSMAVMIRSGITLSEALITVEALHGNKHLAERVAAAREIVIEGGSLSQPLAEKHAFMPMLSRMVAIGESTGDLDDVLEQVTKFHEKRLQATIKQLGKLIEPATIITVGGIVGYVYLAFFMALFAAGG